jgi:hypothetical protein
LQRAENELLDFYNKLNDFQKMTMLYHHGQKEFYKKELERAKEQIQKAEVRLLELRAQANSKVATDSDYKAAADNPIQQKILQNRMAYFRYTSIIRKARQELVRAIDKGDQSGVQKLDIFIHDLFGLLGITVDYLESMDKEWYDVNKILDPLFNPFYSLTCSLPCQQRNPKWEIEIFLETIGHPLIFFSSVMQLILGGLRLYYGR